MKRLICMALAILICSSLALSVSASAHELKKQTETAAEEETFVTPAGEEINAATTWYTWVAKTALKWAIYKIDNSLYNVPASKSYARDYYRVCSGSIYYNANGNGSTTYTEINARTAYKTVDMTVSISASSSFLNGLTGTIAYSLVKEGSFAPVKSGTLGMNGAAYYNITSSAKQGNYCVYYSTPNKQKWTSTVTLYDNAAPVVPNLPYDIGKPIIENQFIDEENMRVYNIPSQQFMEQKAVADTRAAGSRKNTLTADELYEEFWDEGLNDFVFNLKSYREGDKITVKDVIVDAVYDADEDRTVLELHTKRGPAYWPFDGDITAKYGKGDTIKLTFTVEEESNHGPVQLLTLNYFKVAEKALVDEGVAVQISDFTANSRN